MMLFVGFAWGATSNHNNVLITINIQGITGDALKNVQSRLEIMKRSLHEKYTKENMAHFLRIIPKGVKEALNPFGYFHAKVYVQSTKQQGAWIINITISPGPVVLMHQIDIKVQGAGANSHVFEKFLNNIPIKTGQALDIKKYNDVKQDLFDLALANGYFDAKLVSSKILIDLPLHKADITIIFDTGPNYFFGKTTFSEVPLKTSFLERFLPYKKGDLYQNSSIQKLQQALTNSGYFQSVSVQPYPKKAENYYIPIDVNLTTSKPRVYSVGVGYGTDTGLRALLGLRIRRLNSRGHKLNLTLSGSQLKNSFVTTYTIPGKYPQTDKWFISGGYGTENDNKGQSKAFKISVGYSWQWKGWQPTASLIALKERYNLIDQPKTDTHMLMPSFQIQKVHKDNPNNPTKGYRLELGALGALEKFLSKTTFGQINISARGLYTFWENYRFLIRGRMARTIINDLTDLPYSLQLYAGGAHSLRGYAYKQFTPGKNLLTGSVELQRRLFKSLYVVVFYDIGNVNDKWLPVPLNRGIGSGFAWLSPIGTFELTIAKAIDYGDGNHYRIQFAMGTFL